MFQTVKQYLIYRLSSSRTLTLSFFVVTRRCNRRNGTLLVASPNSGDRRVRAHDVRVARLQGDLLERLLQARKVPVLEVRRRIPPLVVVTQGRRDWGKFRSQTSPQNVAYSL